MKQEKPIPLNFDSEIVDGRSVLEAYKVVLGNQWFEPIYRGERVELSDILRDTIYPEWGFKRGVLPDHINNVSINEEGDGEVTLSYTGRLNHDLERKYWEEKGYSTRKVRRSMEVVDADSNVLATYGLNRVLINIDKLDKFIGDMR